MEESLVGAGGGGLRARPSGRIQLHRQPHATTDEVSSHRGKPAAQTTTDSNAEQRNVPAE